MLADLVDELLAQPTLLLDVERDHLGHAEFLVHGWLAVSIYLPEELEVNEVESKVTCWVEVEEEHLIRMPYEQCLLDVVLVVYRLAEGILDVDRLVANVVLGLQLGGAAFCLRFLPQRDGNIVTSLLRR